MMHGFVNQRCEALLRIAVGHANAPKQIVEAVIDTGFTGFLSLPPSTITNLGLPWYFRDVGTLGGNLVRQFSFVKHLPNCLRPFSKHLQIDKGSPKRDDAAFTYPLLN